MNWLGALFLALLSVLPQGQGARPSPIGDDAAKFDELLERAYLHHDVAFAEAAVADDLRYTLSAEPGATAWNKQQFVAAVRFYDGRERNVDAVRVELSGDGIQTYGHIQVKTLRAEGPEYQIYFVRLYRRGPLGWQLATHQTLAQVNRAMLPPLPTKGVNTGIGGGVPPPGVFRAGNGVTLPRLLRDVKPQYTADAMRAQKQGSVLLEVVVDTDGTVGDIIVVRSLDRTDGLDEQAVKAAKQWQFVPGTRNGVAVPVLVSIELSFTLGKR